MKKVILGVVYLLLASVIAQANDGLPQGRWIAEQVTIEKDTDGNIQTTVYNSIEEIQTHIPYPQEMEINEKSIVLHYPEGWEESAGYSLKGDQLTIDIPAGAQTYKYDFKDNKLTLIATYQYVNNDLMAKKSANISEKRVIAFKFNKKEKP